MHISDGLRAYGITRKAVIVVVVLPFLLISLNAVEASLEKNLTSPSHASVDDSVLIAGVFRYLDVTVPSEHENICIIAFNGENEPDPQNRSEENYYTWEYAAGEWTDASGYNSSFIDPSQCYVKNNTYSFSIKISAHAKAGSWTIKVLVDNKESSSVSYNVIICHFYLFFSSIIGVFEPPIRHKTMLRESEASYCNTERKSEENENNIEKIVDRIHGKELTIPTEKKPDRGKRDFSSSATDPFSTQEPIRSTISLYPRSKLKEGTNDKHLSFFNKGNGGSKKEFFSTKRDFSTRLFMIVCSILLLAPSVFPLVTAPGTDEGDSEISIINVQSYPLVGGKWTVMFTTVGQANLTITTVNGTTWSNHDQDHDLRFLECRKDQSTVDYQWMNGSVFIRNFSSNVTCYEVSQVNTPGIHTLRFQFGDDVAYANNLAGEHWLQTSTSDFNNGTKINITVSSGSFHLDEKYYFRNFSRVNNEGFEGIWPPDSWSEDPATSNWHKDSFRALEGTYSAAFDGSGGSGGASGNMISPIMNCSGSNVSAIYVKFWAYSYRGTFGSYYLDYYDGSNWDQITRLDNFGVSSWAQYSQKVTDSQYFVSNFRIRWRVIGLQNNRNYNVDLVNVTVEKNESGYDSIGSLISPAHDTTRVIPDYSNVVITNTTPSGTVISLSARAADTQANLSTATWYSTVSQLPDKRWVQWRINLTGNTYRTPTVNEVNLTWTYDDEDPISSVTSFSPYWQTSQQFQVSATASDNGTGVKEVALYYNFSANNATGWSGWIRFGVNDSTSPYSWSFTSPQGDGYYRFYTKAVDRELHTEDPPNPPGYDAFCGVDIVKPSSQLDEIAPYWFDEPIITVRVNCSIASDSLSGLNHIVLYYRYRRDNASAWGSWTSFSSDTNSPWSWVFNFPKAKGSYQLYSVAVDNAGNTEDPPVSPDNDTDCAFNSTKPYSEVDGISPYWHNTALTVTAQATDFNGSGLHNISLFYYFSSDNSSWSAQSLFGVDTDPWVSISWVFIFPNGSGYYRFFSRAVDNVSAGEYYTGNDSWCGYDIINPSSEVDDVASYWHNLTTNPLSITVTNANDSLSGMKNITLYYRYRTTNTSGWNTWTSFGRDDNSPWSWSFSFPSGNGHYQLYSRGYDAAGNREDPPSSPEYDAEAGYDISKPSSQVDFISPYNVSLSPFALTASASDDVTRVTLWYYYNSQNVSWWNTCWSYRKLLTITGKNAGYQMKIIVGNTSGGNVNCNGHARSDFGDIRFVSYSDNTTQLSYWLKNYTSGTQATFWVNNSRNDTTLWMYYGNSSATTTSSGDSTFYFFDDFSNGLSKWTMDSWNTDAIYINQSQGNSAPALRHDPDNSIPGNRTYFDTRVRTTNYRILDGTIEYDVYLAGTPRIIHQFGWRVNELSWTNGYAWRLQNTNGDGGFFEFSAPTTWTSIGTTFPNAAVNTWYHVQVNISGSGYAAIVNPACGGATTRSVTDTTKTTADYLVSHVHGVTMNSTNYVLVDNVFVRKYRATPPTWNSFGSEETGYITWSNVSNPDTSIPWNWSFNFPNGYGFYWFYSIAIDTNGDQENAPGTADARCRFSIHSAPVINSYDLRNNTGSKLNNATGLLDVNYEYYFTINITVKNSWSYLDYIEIKAWYDNGVESSSYNQTAGGNLNMHLRYQNTTGVANYSLLWPDDEAQIIRQNCSETVINSTTRIVRISFKPFNQTRWANSNTTWNTARNATNDPFSWNFNITARDASGLQSWVRDEYGVYKFATILPEKNWVNVEAPPGYNASSNIVNITYSSNYDFHICIYFEENLTNVTYGEMIPIANNVYICADADPTDDIVNDTVFVGIGETHAIDIVNSSGVFHKNGTSQIVQVQFHVYIPFGTIPGEYSAHVVTKIEQK
jgi:hypothetical protein